MEVLVMTATFAAGLVAVLGAVLVADGWSLTVDAGPRRVEDFTPVFAPLVSEAQVEAIFGTAS